jgi:excisionase family DNA binding protein
LIDYKGSSVQTQASAMRTEPETERNEDVVLTVEEFAQVMRMSARSVRRRIKDGRIRKIEGLGRLVRIDPSERVRLARLNEL